MNSSIKSGLSFGLTSGVITTLGLMVGLTSGTHSVLAVLGGIITIALADAFSDSLGIHISEESKKTKCKNVWKATFSTFLSKFIVASTFIVPVLFLELTKATIVGIVWGLFLVGILSYNISKQNKTKPWKSILEHISITILVIIASHFIGILVSNSFS